MVKLQHTSTRLTISVTEPNLQSGNAVAHVVDGLPPAEETAPEATVAESAAVEDPGGSYESAMTILMDPVQKLGAFAELAIRAKLTDLLSDPDTELTLFTPSDKVQ